MKATHLSARNGRNMTAQGNALDLMSDNNRALKGRDTGTGVVPPIQGLTMTPQFPGRCPGLVYSGPLGLEGRPACLMRITSTPG